MKRIEPAHLRALIIAGGELAILDAREEGEFGAGHLFWVLPCPLSRREVSFRALVPRLTVPIVCVDGGEGHAETLAAWMESVGATDVAVLAGGTKAWDAAGFVLFSGVNVPSKAFGEWVEHHYGTESVDAAELKQWLDEGRDMVVLDSRPFDEFFKMSIPTGQNVPGGELAYRIGDIAPDPATIVVVNCAGRTRSILGAESLRRAGIPNRVFALRNGTMGWELAGFSPERGRRERYSAGVPETRDIALARATAFAEASGVGVIGPLDLARFEADPDRTLFVLDVRDDAEFRAGHRPGSRHAPGGQLVQATDQWIGVRGARIALIDDTGVRARMTGAWLRQMGIRDVFVVEGGLAEVLVEGAAPVAVPEVEAPVPFIGTAELMAMLEEPGLTIIDVARSIDYRAGHVPGAVWGVRTRLDRLRENLATAKRIVVSSPDQVMAQLAVPELMTLTDRPVSVLAGGTAAFRAAGGTLASDPKMPADADCVDCYLRPYDRTSGVAEAMQAYLSWEIDLVGEIARDGTVRFGTDEAG